MAQVPDTSKEYTGTGAQTLFTFDVPYDDADSVFVTVDGVDTPFTFSTPSVVAITPAPANGAAILIYRDTPAEVMDSTFNNGVPFLLKYADKNWRQLLYAMQEIAKDAFKSAFAIRTPEPIPELPDAAARANGALLFDELGNPAIRPYSEITGSEVSGPLSSVDDQVALFSGVTGRLLKAGQTISQILNTFLVSLYNVFPRTVDTYSAFSTTSVLVGQKLTLKQHTSGGLGGGTFIGVPSAGLTVNNGTIAATATPGVFVKRTDYLDISADMFGALGGGVDDRVAVQAAIDYCNATPTVSATKLVLLRMHTVSGTLYIDRPTDTTVGEFVIEGQGERGGFRVLAGIFLFSSRNAYLAGAPYVNNPCSERTTWRNVEFDASAAFVGTTACDDKFLRITFDHCKFRRMRVIKNVSTGYLQTIKMIHCKHHLQSATEYAIDSVDGYDIRVDKAQFENTGGLGFRFTNILRGGHFNGGLYQGSAGQYLRVSGPVGVSVRDNYFEANGGSEIVFGDSGGVSSGVIIDNNIWLLHAPQDADVSYYPIMIGLARNVTVSNNACNGNLVDNLNAQPFSITHYGNEVPTNRKVMRVNTQTDLAITANPAGTQAAAYVLRTPENEVTTAVANASVILPTTTAVQALARVRVKNATGVAINVYPAVGQRFRFLAANAPHSLPAGAVGYFVSSVEGDFWSVQ